MLIFSPLKLVLTLRGLLFWSLICSSTDKIHLNTYNTRGECVTGFRHRHTLNNLTLPRVLDDWNCRFGMGYLHSIQENEKVQCFDKWNDNIGRSRWWVVIDEPDNCFCECLTLCFASGHHGMLVKRDKFFFVYRLRRCMSPDRCLIFEHFGHGEIRCGFPH